MQYKAASHMPHFRHRPALKIKGHDLGDQLELAITQPVERSASVRMRARAHVRMGPCVHVCVRQLAWAHGCAHAGEPQKDRIQVSVVIGHALQSHRQRLLQHVIKY